MVESLILSGIQHFLINGTNQVYQVYLGLPGLPSLHSFLPRFTTGLPQVYGNTHWLFEMLNFDNFPPLSICLGSYS